MTPEEVVFELKHFLKNIEQFPNDDTFRYELDRSDVTVILAAIRAAENEALERAAIWHEEQSKKCGLQIQWQNPSETIRALKHKDVE